MSGEAEFSLSGGNEEERATTMAPNEKKQQEFDSVVQLERNEEVATVGVLAIQVLSYLRKKLLYINCALPFAKRHFQGAFAEHVASLRRAAAELEGEGRKKSVEYEHKYL